MGNHQLGISLGRSVSCKKFVCLPFLHLYIWDVIRNSLFFILFLFPESVIGCEKHYINTSYMGNIMCVPTGCNVTLVFFLTHLGKKRRIRIIGIIILINKCGYKEDENGIYPVFRFDSICNLWSSSRLHVIIDEGLITSSKGVFGIFLDFWAFLGIFRNFWGVFWDFLGFFS